MPIAYNHYMNQDRVKEILLEIEETELDFSVVFTGKASKKVNGLYKPDIHEIILHNKNFSNDNELIYTAVHEYTHHKQCEKDGGFYSAKVHTPKFWSEFHRLLEKAEAKCFYRLTVEESPELAALTEEIKQVILPQDGKLVKELGRLLGKARTLCKKAGVRYEDYIDRVLGLPRPAAAAMEKISVYDVNPGLGYETMKIVANIGNPDKRAEAENLFLSKNSPASVRGKLTPKKEEDPRTSLEKEKRRLEKTIVSLQAKLETIESRLANMPIQPFIIALALSFTLLRPLTAQDKNGEADIPAVPSVPAIDIPKSGTGARPVIPKPFKIDMPKLESTKPKNGPNKPAPFGYIDFLETTEAGKRLQKLMDTKITDDAGGENILDTLIENLTSAEKNGSTEKIHTIKNRTSIKLKVFKINGKDMTEEFSHFETSSLTYNKNFLSVGKTKGRKEKSEQEEVFIFARKTDPDGYKLFIGLRQQSMNAFTSLYTLKKHSPLEASLVKNLVIAQSEKGGLDLILIFSIEE